MVAQDVRIIRQRKSDGAARVRRRACFVPEFPLSNRFVPVFDRIFNFDQAEVARMEQRLNSRYSPGAAFPLQAWLLTEGNETPARILNISGNGIGLLLEPDTLPAEDDAVRVRLRFGAHQQLVDGRVVHLRPEGAKAYCGIGFKFADFAARKTYLQLLQPITIGQSLRPVPPEQVVQDNPEFLKRFFRGDDNSQLTVWFDQAPDHAIRRFEFQMKDYFCQLDRSSGVLEVQVLSGANTRAGRSSNPVFDISGSLQAEIRQLFRWTLPNLSDAVPDDIRAFLQRYAT
jgi:hypothetical protein